MSSTHETLFSLELVIDYVRFDCTRGNVLDPAVGLRFLDFPTLLIYPSGREDHSSHSAYADLTLPAKVLSQSEERDKYFFHKGKSCLFKINLDSLHNHLSSTPLYAMVLDIKDEVPKLIGSSLISLAKVTERIKMDVDKHGIGNPSSYGEKIITPLCNLMGNSIGAISLAYKIVSLGANLIPHIPYNRVYKVGLTHGKGEQDPKALAESAGVFNIDTHQMEMQHATVLSSVSPDGQPDNKMRSDAKQPGIAAFTQTEPTKQKVTWSEMSYSNDEQDNTTFCPPPLFYSSSVKNQQESDAETCRMSNVEIDSLNIEDPEDKNNELESAEMHDVNKITAAKHRSTLASSPKQQHRITEPAGDVIRQLPLLNALLNELSLLNNQAQHQQPVSVHPNLVWLYTSAQEPHPLSAPGAKPKSEYQKRVAASSQSPQQRQCQSKMKGCIIPPVSPSARKAGSARKHQEMLQPKRKLKYGLTNTFRLRLQHVTTAHTKHHQCIEYKGIQQVKPLRQTLPDRKHAGKSVRRGVNSDETIETLINSFEVDTTPAETTSSKLQTKPTKNVTSMPKVPKDEATEPTRKVRVHVPSVLSHYSDRSDSSVQSVHHGSNKTNPGLQIFSESGRADSRSNSPSHRKSLTSSSEQEYQDDFTSLDATDSFSPEPLSSPEPYQHQRNRVSCEHSSSDDGSNISKGLPVPVKADNSPHRSLKCTHVIRPRPQTSALSLSSESDEDGSNPASSGHQRSGSQISGRKTSSVRRTFGRSESCDADPVDGSMTLSRVSIDSVVATNNSLLKSFSPVEQVEAREEQDELGSLGLDKNYHHVSELMINKLPGYTL